MSHKLQRPQWLQSLRRCWNTTSQQDESAEEHKLTPTATCIFTIHGAFLMFFNYYISVSLHMNYAWQKRYQVHTGLTSSTAVFNQIQPGIVGAGEDLKDALTSRLFHPLYAFEITLTFLNTVFRGFWRRLSIASLIDCLAEEMWWKMTRLLDTEWDCNGVPKKGLTVNTFQNANK